MLCRRADAASVEVEPRDEVGASIEVPEQLMERVSSRVTSDQRENRDIPLVRLNAQVSMTENHRGEAHTFGL